MLLASLARVIYIAILPRTRAHGMVQVKRPLAFIAQTRSVDRRAATPSRGSQAPGQAGGSSSRAPGLGRPARRRARQGGDRAGFPQRARDRLQHQRRDHDARFRQCPHLRLVHPRRRHGPRRDDGLAQSHHRARSFHLSRAALGARRRLGAVRRIFQQRRAVPFLAAASAAPAAQAARRTRACACSSGWRSSGICCASRRTRSATTISAFPACAGSRSKRRRPSPAFPTTPNPTWI